MAELVVTRGLPGSGKTTWAQEWVDEGERRARRAIGTLAGGDGP